MTFQSILENAGRLWKDKPFIYTRSGMEFTAKTFGEFAADVHALSAALQKQGFAGKNILIFGENSYEWMVADYAVCGYVGVSAVISKDTIRDDLLLAIENTDIAAVFYSQKFSEVVAGLGEMLDIPFFSLQIDLYRLIESSSVTGYVTPEPDVNVLSKIFFTSGTTGFPKAAMLSQKNIFSGIECLKLRAPMDENDSGYLFLPLSHTYGGIYNFTYCLIFGAALYLCSDISLIAQELQIVRPTIFCAVPRILERFLASAKSSEHPAQTLKQMFGGNLRYLFCSGGPWRTEDRAFYKNSGINLLEAYALTETSSSLSISYSGESETESVGVVFENLDVSIAEPDENGYGEILVRGENVFLGYYNNEQATKAAIDTAGFLHTGDIGKADSTGHLYITGRKTRLFKTSAGEYVSPERIELLLLSRPGIKSAYVRSNAGHVAAAVELSDPSQDIAGIIDEINRELPAYMHIDEYSVMENPTDEADSNWKTTPAERVPSS